MRTILTKSAWTIAHTIKISHISLQKGKGYVILWFYFFFKSIDNRYILIIKLFDLRIQSVNYHNVVYFVYSLILFGIYLFFASSIKNFVSSICTSMFHKLIQGCFCYNTECFCHFFQMVIALLYNYAACSWLSQLVSMPFGNFKYKLSSRN